MRFLRKNKRPDAEALIKSGAPRAIEIHSVTPQPPGAAGSRPDFLRVAFIFKDPPGPWTLQFYEARADQPAVAAKLACGSRHRFYESEDQARTRVLVTEDGEPLWPR